MSTATHAFIQCLACPPVATNLHCECGQPRFVHQFAPITYAELQLLDSNTGTQ